MVMSRVEFGVMLRQEKTDFAAVRSAAVLCEELGFDSVWLYDHLLGMGGPTQDILESWTLMSALAPVTTRIKLGTMVICNGFRHPALLAKMGATLDVISGGRLELAIGAGWHEPEFRAYGFPFLDTRTRIEQLAEGVQIIRALWEDEGEGVSFSGKHYTIHASHCHPKPAQSPRPAITIGGSGERHLLRTVAGYADCWNCPATHAGELERRKAALYAHCADLGRDPSEIIISEQTVCVIVAHRNELEEKLAKGKRRYGFFGDIERTGIIGTPQECIEAIRGKRAMGVSKLTIFFSDMNNPDTMRLFAEEVMPEFH